MYKKHGTPRRRARGENTRRDILEATLRVIAALGLRGVTHRAVATEAGVQFSLVSYYFKDIQDLQVEAFGYLVERGRAELEALWTEVFARLDATSARQLRTVEGRGELCDALAQLASSYLLRQLRGRHRVGLVVEQAFLTEAGRVPRLRELGEAHRARLLAPLTELCRRLNPDDPEVDAALLLGTLTNLEYTALAQKPSQLDRAQLERAVRRQLGWFLGLGRR